MAIYCKCNGVPTSIRFACMTPQKPSAQHSLYMSVLASLWLANLISASTVCTSVHAFKSGRSDATHGTSACRAVLCACAPFVDYVTALKLAFYTPLTRIRTTTSQAPGNVRFCSALNSICQLYFSSLPTRFSFLSNYSS